MTRALILDPRSIGHSVTAVVIPFPVPPNPNSLTKRDLGEITAESRTLPGPWVVEVASSRDRPDGPDEVSVFLFLRKVSITEPRFIIRRGGLMIRVAVHHFSADGVMDCATLGDFPSIAAALDAIRHDARIMAMEWGIEPSVPGDKARCPKALNGIIGGKPFDARRASFKVVQPARRPD